MTLIPGGKEGNPDHLRRSLILLLLANLTFFSPYLFETEPVTIGAKNGDLLPRFMPIRQFAFSQLAQGTPPFWNPFNFSGHPFLADPETAMFYPFTYLFAVLPAHLAFSWNYFLHYLLGGIGLLLYCRRLNFSPIASLAAAFVFELSAPTILQMYAGHLTPLSAMVWTPWLLWGLERFFSRPSWSNGACFGLLLALQFLSGYAPFTYLTGWLLLAYFLHAWVIHRDEWRKLSYRLVCATLLALAVFLTQLGLALELHKHSTRKATNLEFSSSYSIDRENIITLLTGKYYGESSDDKNNPGSYFGKSILWENSCYMGIISLTLSLIAMSDWRNRTTRFWLVTALLTFIVALGTLTPLFTFLYKVLPGFSLFRGYAKTLVFTTLAVAILAGRGLDCLARAKPWNRVVCLIIPAFMIILFVLSLSPENLPFWKGVLTETYSTWGMPLDQKTIDARLHFLQNGLFVSMLLSCLATAIYWLQNGVDFLKKYHKTLLLGLLLTDLFAYAKPYFSPLDLKTYRIPESMYHPILQEPAWARVFHSHWLIANIMFPRGVSSVGGHEAFVLREYKNLVNEINSDHQDGYLVLNPSQRNMDFLAAEYIMTPFKLEAPFPVDLVASGVSELQYYLYRRPGSFSRYQIAHKTKLITAADNQYSDFVTLMLREYPKTVFVLPDTYSALFLKNLKETDVQGGKESVTVVSEEINRVALNVQLEKDGILTVSENYFPGWHALVDGKETDVFPANLFMKGVHLPSGNHRVELYFMPTHLLGYGLISATSLLTLIGIALL